MEVRPGPKALRYREGTIFLLLQVSRRSFRIYSRQLSIIHGIWDSSCAEYYRFQDSFRENNKNILHGTFQILKNLSGNSPPPPHHLAIILSIIICKINQISLEYKESSPVDELPMNGYYLKKSSSGLIRSVIDRKEQSFKVGLIANLGSQQAPHRTTTVFVRTVVNPIPEQLRPGIRITFPPQRWRRRRRTTWEWQFRATVRPQ